MKRIEKAMEMPAARTSLGLLLAFAGGFVFSGSAVAGVASFADISLAGALELPYAAAALIGGIVRGVLTDSVGRGIVKLAAMSFIVIAKLFTGGRESPIRCGIITAAAVMLSGAAVSSLIGEMPQKLLFYAFYAALSGFSTFCGAELISSLSSEKVISLRGFSGGCYAVIYIVYIASLYSLKLPAVNAGFIVGAAMTLFAACFYGGVGGVTVGGLTAFGAFLVSSDVGISSAVLPAAGLFAGLVKKDSKFLSAVLFSLLCYAMSVLTGAFTDGADITLSVVCGAALFVIVSPHFSDRWISAGESGHAESNGISYERTGFLSDVIEAVRVDAGRVSAALWAADTEPEPEVKQTVCGACVRRSVCEGFDSETAGEIVPDLPERCVKKRELAEEFEKDFRDRTARQLMKLRYSQERSLLNEQLRIMEEVLRSTTENRDIRPSEKVSRRIRELLEAHGLSPIRTSAYYNPSNRLVAEIYFGSDDIPSGSSRICDLVSDGLGLELTAAAPVSSAKEHRVCLYERPQYSAEIYSASVCAEGSEVSGDSSVVFTDSEGMCYVALSDGMGTGKSAAVDSHMVIGLFRRLVCGGMDCVSAVKLVNSVMVNKCRDESFATFDAIRFDPDNCLLTAIKSGAAATLIRRGDSVMKTFAPTFPIGINENAEVFTADFELDNNDIVIMFSDGISENAFLFIKELLLGGDDVQEIVREIAVKSSTFRQSEHTDDVTVIGVKIFKN